MCGGGDAPEVKETPEQKELARIAAERWDRVEDVFRPVEDRFIEEMRSIDQGDEDLAQGLATSATQQAFEDTGEEVTRSQMQAGAAPGSGRFDEAVSGVAEDRGRGLGLGKTRAGVDTENRRLKGLEKAIDIGLGKANDAQVGITQAASRAQKDAVAEARTSFRRHAGRQNALGRAAGFMYGEFSKDKPAEGG